MTSVLKVGRQVEKAKRCARCVKKRRSVGERDSVGGTMDDKREGKKGGRNNSGGEEEEEEEETDGFASGGVCEVGARPLSPPSDKHRFAYDRHFAGSII